MSKKNSEDHQPKKPLAEKEKQLENIYPEIRKQTQEQMDEQMEGQMEDQMEKQEQMDLLRRELMEMGTHSKTESSFGDSMSLKTFDTGRKITDEVLVT